MNADYINPFLKGTINVLKTMAMMEPLPGKPYLKDEGAFSGDISGVIGITGATEGSMAVSFSESCILKIVSNMLGEEYTEMNPDIVDAVGEITNMISGDARRILGELGISLEASIPTVIRGSGHILEHVANSPTIIIPFDTSHGEFTVEICFVR